MLPLQPFLRLLHRPEMHLQMTGQLLSHNQDELVKDKDYYNHLEDSGIVLKHLMGAVIISRIG